MNGVSQQYFDVVTSYDAEGNTIRVVRKPQNSAIDSLITQWAYDNAGRVVKEIAPDGHRDSTKYDPAGNVEERITRRGNRIVMKYDALNRLTQRIVPDTVIPKWSGVGILQHAAGSGYSIDFMQPYPRFGNGTGYHIPADTASFTYDTNGNLLTANNHDARITRTYYDNGLLKTERQQIRTLKELSAGGNDTTAQLHDHVHVRSKRPPDRDQAPRQSRAAGRRSRQGPDELSLH